MCILTMDRYRCRLDHSLQECRELDGKYTVLAEHHVRLTHQSANIEARLAATRAELKKRSIIARITRITLSKGSILGSYSIRGD